MLRVQIQFLLFLLVASATFAGEVRLKDGSLLKGKVLKIYKEVLVIQTEFIGNVSVKMENVESVESDEVVNIRKDDGVVEEKKYESDHDGLLLTLWSDGQDPDIL